MSTLPARAALALAVVLVNTACAVSRSSMDVLNATPPTEYRGHFTAGSAGSWFLPCGVRDTADAWWVTLTGTSVTQIEAARRDGRVRADLPSYVRWRAVFTRGGEVGPPGRGALLVREVIEARPRGDGDCTARQSTNTW
jgi:hypothetical protein